MSRAYSAAIGIYKEQIYTFDFGSTDDFGSGFQILLADVGVLDRPAIKAAIAANTDLLTVGPIQFNLRDCSANFKGARIGPTSWITSDYADTLIMCSLPATRDEIVYLVKSLIHLLEST
jgi:hypothetical protein